MCLLEIVEWVSCELLNRYLVVADLTANPFDFNGEY